MELLIENNGVRLLSGEKRLVLEAERAKLIYHLDTGIFDFESSGLLVLREAYSGAVEESGGNILSTQGTRKLAGYTEIQDELGNGLQMTVTTEESKLKLSQTFTVYRNKSYVLTSLELEGSEGVSTNYMAPVLAVDRGIGSVVDIGSCIDMRALFVPYDNDYWVRYRSCPLKDAKPGYVYPDDRRPRNREIYQEGIQQSYEVAAVFDNESRKSLILGSVSHDRWKTGIKITGTPEGGVAKLEVYGGCADRFTRDYLPHGFVKGCSVASPTILLGYYMDYRSGMEEFGKVCTALRPAMQWEEGPIFGWNAYAGYEDRMDYDRFVHTSRFLKQNLQSKGFSNNGVIYINFDYLWHNLTEKQLCKTVEIARKNNQYAGIYFTPFSVFTDDLDTVIEGTDGRYTYRDIILRDYEGNPLPKVNDGTQGYAVDPTHPGSLMRVEHMMNCFIQWGFSFIKLDFIAHGAIEGHHYDPAVHTGKQAYDFGMKHLCSLVAPERIGRPFFISLSIAPAFPYHGHSRRISCDAFGHIEDSEYMLNSLSYGWWMNGSLYCFNDPDHIVINRRRNCPRITEQEARTRITSGIITGGIFLNSDAFMDKMARGRAIKLLTNERLNGIVKKGVSFRPVEGNSGNGASELFYRNDGDEFFLAVFNYERKTAVKTIKLERTGLEPDREYLFENLWDGSNIVAKGTLAIRLSPCESVLLCTKLERERKNNESMV